MQDISVAFGRVSNAAFSANPELKNEVTELVNRAYYNLHGTALTHADQAWAGTIIAAAMQLCLDSRVRELNTRELLNLFQNVIRVSEEHTREARRHAAMASNVFYLKETALDATLLEIPNVPAYAQTQVLSIQLAADRVAAPAEEDAA